MFRQGLPKRFKKPKGWLWGQFNNARGATLRFGQLSKHKEPLAHIVYVEGLSEFAEKTFELARDFNKMACNFSVFDRHGQGKSTRYLSNPHKQHSEGLDHDIDDLIQFCREHIPADEPVVLLGHSTGGLITLLALEREPDLFKGAAVTAPLLGLRIDYVANVEDVIARIPFPKSMRERYIPGGKDWEARSHPDSNLRPEDFSSDPKRNMISDYWKIKEPDIQAGSPTLGWVKEMCKGMVKVRDPEFLKNIKRPVLWMTAGQDKLVALKPILEVIKNMKNKRHLHFDEAQHEILVEKNKIRGPAMQEIYDFLKNDI